VVTERLPTGLRVSGNLRAHVAAMKSLKDAKRRVVQKAAEAMGSAQRVGLDAEEYQDAVSNFKKLESDLKDVLDSIKSSRDTTAKWTERNVTVAETLSQFFASDDGGGRDSLRDASEVLHKSMTRGHDIVQRSVASKVEENAIKPLSDLLTDRFPALKKRIAEHSALETDYSSYVRRLEGLKDKPVDDPERIKFQQKHDKAKFEYEALHHQLMSELRELYNERHSALRKPFIAIMAAQAELQSQLAEDLNRVLEDIDQGDVQLLRNEIASTIKAGGPVGGPAESSSRSTRSLLGGLGSSSLVKKSTTTESPVTGADIKKAPTSPASGAYKPGVSFDQSRAPPPPPPPGPNPFAPSAKEVAVAMFDYDGQDEGDLSFRAGDVITVQEKIDAGCTFFAARVVHHGFIIKN